jgi:hypothetical protein
MNQARDQSAPSSHRAILRIRNAFQTSLCRRTAREVEIATRIGLPEVHEALPKGILVLSRGLVFRDYIPDVLGIE